MKKVTNTESPLESGLVWASYIPLYITPIMKSDSIWSRFLYKFEQIFYNICFHYKLDNFPYIKECAEDFYLKFGTPNKLFFRATKYSPDSIKDIYSRYVNKKVNPMYYSKIK